MLKKCLMMPIGVIFPFVNAHVSPPVLYLSVDQYYSVGFIAGQRGRCVMVAATDRTEYL